MEHDENRLYELDKSLFHILKSISGFNSVQNSANFFDEKNRTLEERWTLIDKTVNFITRTISGIPSRETLEYLESRQFNFNEL